MSRRWDVASFLSPLGLIALVAGGEGIVRVLICADEVELQRRLEVEFFGAVLREDCGGEAEKGVLQLKEYFSGSRWHFSLRLDFSGVAPYSRAVFTQLCDIPYATTISYRELAEKSGSVGAARAVGQVMRRNRWPLLLPCHRVVASDGHCGGYSAASGETAKCWLHAFEKAMLVERGNKKSQKNLDSPSIRLL
ncbi:MAG: cysteine methyltransferase [Desulfuromonas sp.]|nr:MAG: cysteine methyltransferase [Desulfuromonas sp.]